MTKLSLTQSDPHRHSLLTSAPFISLFPGLDSNEKDHNLGEQGKEAGPSRLKLGQHVLLESLIYHSFNGKCLETKINSGVLRRLQQPPPTYVEVKSDIILLVVTVVSSSSRKKYKSPCTDINSDELDLLEVNIDHTVVYRSSCK
ncbi:unnamed protein product [Sphenostylis stenocarpa]|uniref:Uncharacterized protein n=1 Tax=Sphenostylis stenocarpa TaxID=92480 RepID=A0AA86SKD4_9FABA|nr:unnamed protein product [Sphenostylis stenocarpa]